MTDQILSFETFEMDYAERQLRDAGTEVRIEPQVFDLIWYMATNPGRLISKDDLIDHIWCGRIVSDAAISTRINAARTALNAGSWLVVMIRLRSVRCFS